MATVYAPIAKDSSINTTESPSRNIADVLAQELSGIANAITGGADKVPKTDIATVEPTNTASRAYSIGELVYVNGNLYKVITAISIGATFTVGTNIQSTNVSDACKNDLIIMRNFAITSDFPTVNANSTSNVNIPSYSVPLGYYPIGVIQISTGQQQLALEAYTIDGTACSLRIRNVTSNNLSCGPSIRVAFMKDIYIDR